MWKENNTDKMTKVDVSTLYLAFKYIDSILILST